MAIPPSGQEPKRLDNNTDNKMPTDSPAKSTFKDQVNKAVDAVGNTILGAAGKIEDMNTMRKEKGAKAMIKQGSKDLKSAAAKALGISKSESKK